MAKKKSTKKKVAAKKKAATRVNLKTKAVKLTFEIQPRKRDFKPGIDLDVAKIIEVKPIKRKKEIKKKTSKYWLTHRTKLTDEQMDRAKQESAGGQDTKYIKQEDGSFKQSLKLTQALRLAYNRAQKWVLYSDEHKRNIYIAQDKQAGITLDLEKARLFADGFDEPEFKATYYGGLFNLKLKFHRITIKPDQIKLKEQIKPKENVADSSLQSDGQFMHDQSMMHDPDEDI